MEVLDTASWVWLDRKGPISSKANRASDSDPFPDLLRRCRHASASVGTRLYVYGGLKGGIFWYLFFNLFSSIKDIQF